MGTGVALSDRQIVGSRPGLDSAGQIRLEAALIETPTSSHRSDTARYRVS